jgi:hypothetical protein
MVCVFGQTYFSLPFHDLDDSWGVLDNIYDRDYHEIEVESRQEKCEFRPKII